MEQRKGTSCAEAHDGDNEEKANENLGLYFHVEAWGIEAEEVAKRLP